ncbi:MAG TPA: YceI family protein [Longimicrobiaceae bacterium]
MNKHLRQVGLAVGLLGIVAISTAALKPDFGFTPESRVWVEGTSSVRSYTCQAAEVKGTVESTVPAFDVTRLEGAVARAEVVIDAAALDCGNGTMNGHMRKALKVSEHGTISFRLSDYRAIPAGAETQLKLNGTLEIAGTAQPITVDAMAAAAGGGAIRVKGTHTIKMTDYGVRPPSLMLGTMKVHDPVKLNFDVVLKP